ncbi:hypothetical protein [Terriglobus roseus]|uniref:Uncharacterized protein n=1 Tax=Terriglobus roseus TaxID=392734 RepID=A0A1G7MZL1_9BACT|nr:hypothetical protein [Terriglobus roseus]SDF67152.1 hypothetical protein SAMN05444167_2956 [Terriglobus roseus]
MKISVALVCYLFSCLLASAQTNVSNANSPAIIKAGENFSFSIDVAKSYNVGANVDGNFISEDLSKDPGNSIRRQFHCSGTIPIGLKHSTLICTLPRDLIAGTYKFGGNLGVSRLGYTNQLPLTVPEITIQVLAEDSIDPEAANTGQIILQLTQAQILRSRAGNLQNVLNDLTTSTFGKGADTSSMRDVLIRALREAGEQLRQARVGFESIHADPNVSSVVMFDDFHRHYQAALVELRAPQLSTMVEDHPRLFQVSFIQKRPSTSDNVEVKDKKSKFSHSIALIASGVVELIGQNIAAFNKAAETATDVFQLDLRSSPSDARIFYVRIGEEEQEYTRHTDVEKASFPFAKWTFIFRKDGCQQTVTTPNLYVEVHPSLSVTLNCAGR